MDAYNSTIELGVRNSAKVSQDQVCTSYYYHLWAFAGSPTQVNHEKESVCIGHLELTLLTNLPSSDITTLVQPYPNLRLHDF